LFETELALSMVRPDVGNVRTPLMMPALALVPATLLM